MRPVHALLLVLPLCAYLFYRTVATDARLDALDRRLEVLSDASADGRPAIGSIAATTTGPSAAAAPDVAELRAEVRALQTRIAQVVRPLDTDSAHEQILDVVEQERQRVFNKQIDFHQERWHEAREDVLEKLVVLAKLTESQRKQVGAAMADEVDALAELVRAPRALEHPEQLANDVMQLLDETSVRVRSALNPDQQPVWDRHRARERKGTYAWLPR